eukprot:5120977-Heterocapsa_arctica.AAC.1
MLLRAGDPMLEGDQRIALWVEQDSQDGQHGQPREEARGRRPVQDHGPLRPRRRNEGNGPLICHKTQAVGLPGEGTIPQGVGQGLRHVHELGKVAGEPPD